MSHLAAGLTFSACRASNRLFRRFTAQLSSPTIDRTDSRRDPSASFQHCAVQARPCPERFTRRNLRLAAMNRTDPSGGLSTTRPPDGETPPSNSRRHRRVISFRSPKAATMCLKQGLVSKENQSRQSQTNLALTSA